MRALRTLLIVVVILGGLFVAADRLAVGFAEDEVADRVRAAEDLATTPDVSIEGFPFLTQLAGGELDEVKVGIDGYEAATGDGTTIRIDDLRADMRGVAFSGDFGSATAATATGTATIPYGELLKAAQAEPARIGPGITARLAGLSDGGDGKIKVELEVSLFGAELPRRVSLLSSVAVRGDRVEVRADGLPGIGGVEVAESRIRAVSDFRQVIDRLPGGIRLDRVAAAPDGVEITVKGSDVRLAG
ncbi:LmeA family phospholipid-binding protein [Streptomyces sp. PRKS01-65]|nr:DUF2993 domain-containing protein [Streptomyces harenosi]NEY33532.1 LmeA family phospholipid-binding protein [Streptomyces harenosi]